MKHFCMNCGKEFAANNNMVRYCDACKEEIAQRQKEKQKHYARARVEKLGLVNLSVYKADRETIKALAIAKGVTVSDMVQDILKHYDDTPATTAPKTAPKAKAKEKQKV